MGYYLCILFLSHTSCLLHSASWFLHFSFCIYCLHLLVTWYFVPNVWNSHLKPGTFHSASDAWHLALGVWHLECKLWHQVYCILHHIYCSWTLVSNTLYQMNSIWYLLPVISYVEFCFWYLVSDIHYLTSGIKASVVRCKPNDILNLVFFILLPAYFVSHKIPGPNILPKKLEDRLWS